MFPSTAPHQALAAAMQELPACDRRSYRTFGRDADITHAAG